MGRHLLDAEEDSMERKDLDQLERIAEIHGPQMSKQQRLMRWADVLERQAKPHSDVAHGVEYLSPQERAKTQVYNSALSVAFEDPVLRAEGLASDKFGDAVNFFQLSEDEVHWWSATATHGHHVDAGTVPAWCVTSPPGRGVAPPGAGSANSPLRPASQAGSHR